MNDDRKETIFCLIDNMKKTEMRGGVSITDLIQYTNVTKEELHELFLSGDIYETAPNYIQVLR